MSLQMMMKIAGVSGDAKSFDHEGWSEILSWNWGMTSNRKISTTSDADRTAFNEMSITKPLGADSPAIRLLFAKGEPIESMDLIVLPVVGKREMQTKYVHLRLESVIIKSVVIGGGIEDNFFKEHITLLFDRIRFEYSRPGSASSGKSAEDFSFGWNLGTNAEWRQ